MGKRRLFVDMDGTLAEWKPTKKLETLYEEGYFLNLKPYENVVEAIKLIINQNPNIEVFVLSAYLRDSDYALSEKNTWLDKYLPEIDAEHRIFCTCQTRVNKKEYVPGGILETDCLLDDHSPNLNDWEPPAIGLKLLNGINGAGINWQGERISREDDPELLRSKIYSHVFSDIAVDPDPEDDVEL